MSLRGAWQPARLPKGPKQSKNEYDITVEKGIITFIIQKTGGWDESREVFDQIFVNKIERKFPKEPFFLVDFPYSLFSPLCKAQKEKPYLAERFELYINGMEIGNGNTENTDADSVRKALKKPIDEMFMSALKTMRKKTYAGMGLGIDRLAMLFRG